MESSEYRFLRDSVGWSQDQASKVLNVCVATIHNRERGHRTITREAEFAIRWAVQQEQATPTAKVTRVTPHYGPKRKR